MHPARARGPWRADRLRLRDDAGAAGALTECGVPGAILGEQSGHLGETIVIEVETIGRQQFADRVLFGFFGGHDTLPRRGGEGSMHGFDVNWLAVLVAAVLKFVIGGVWYSPPVFGPRWGAIVGV